MLINVKRLTLFRIDSDSARHWHIGCCIFVSKLFTILKSSENGNNKISTSINRFLQFHHQHAGHEQQHHRHRRHRDQRIDV